MRRLAIHCEFHGYLNDALQDQLVCELQNQNIQNKLLSEDHLTSTKALKLVLDMEPMEANITKLQGSELTQVSVVQQSTKKSDLTPHKVVGGSPLSSLRSREGQIHR